MAVLSLREAAEQAGTSKVDIWRAIRSGMLPARKTPDGDFVIDPAELFRVFETQRPKQCPTGPDATASPEPPHATASPEQRPESRATPETPATSDMTVAFAALGAELRELLAGVRANDEQHQARTNGAGQPSGLSLDRSCGRGGGASAGR
jgi:hypothetical protein